MRSRIIPATILICATLLRAPIAASATPASVTPQQLALAKAAYVLLRESMRNPASLSLIRVGYLKKTGDVCFIYRAQNGFGGYSIGHSYFDKKHGQIISENYMWNDTGCIYQGGIDITDAVRPAKTYQNPP